jgi:hypothetical protein
MIDLLLCAGTQTPTLANAANSRGGLRLPQSEAQAGVPLPPGLVTPGLLRRAPLQPRAA